jgi:cytochrome d ubiquinol oxidase subunit I
VTVEILSRLQFALTVSFHYLYPPLSIGLGLLLVFMEGAYLWTKNQLYHDMAHFWTKIFGLIFAIGVATGIVMEFEFGTNWAAYSRFVGDVFGSALAAEGIFAFFLESGFFALLLFGWDKVPPWLHFFSTLMVCLGAHFSAVWIVIANSWMQTPAGYHIELNGKAMPLSYQPTPNELLQSRAVIDDFWGMVFNPSAMDRLIHVILGAWLAGICLLLSVSAYYLLKNRHQAIAIMGLKMGLPLLCITLSLQGISGDQTAKGVAENQPIKLAAREGLWETQSHAPLSLFGWVDHTGEKTYSIAIPNLLSYLIGNSSETIVPGLKAFSSTDWPRINAVYQCYHLMLAMAGLLGIIVVWGLWLFYKKILFDRGHSQTRWYWRLLVLSVLFPQIANQAGWYTAELGRQPWLVYGLMRTHQGLSAAIKAEQVLFSIILFTTIYTLLFCTFIYLLNKKIQAGPE